MRLQEAAAALGVHYQTAYGWVRDGTLKATLRGRSYEVAPEDVEALQRRRAEGSPPTRPITIRDWSVHADGLYAALANGDDADARRRLDRLARGGVPVVDLCDLVLAPALRQIGDAWASNTLSVAEEHRASAIAERLIAPLLMPRPGRPRGTVVVTTPPGERHALPASMAAAALRAAHWHVQHLAYDLPVADLVALTRRVHADTVVLSAATAEGATAAEETAVAVERELPYVRVHAGRPRVPLSSLLNRMETGRTNERNHP